MNKFMLLSFAGAALKGVKTACLLSLPVLLVEGPVKAQFINEYNNQRSAEEKAQRNLERNVLTVCKYGQFIGPHFGASGVRSVYLVDNDKNIFTYSDDTESSSNYQEGTDIVSTSRLTCKLSRDFMLSKGYRHLGKLGKVVKCGSGVYCQYSAEAVGLYVYKKYSGSSEITKTLIAPRKERIIMQDGDLRLCNGYQPGADEARACFGN